MSEELKKFAQELYDGGMRCNCDLDNWEPESTTGHSHVCRIHAKALHTGLLAMRERRKQKEVVK